MRDHEPIVIENFNGLWVRGGKDSVPLDHFADAVNITYLHAGSSGFETRDGWEPFINPRVNGAHSVVRMYTFNTALDGIITLDTGGNFYHIVPGTSNTLIGTVAGATDFTMAIANGRAYINPIGVPSFIYVYNGDNTLMRKVGGNPPTGSGMTAANSGTGNVEAGIHIFGVVYKTNSGFLTQIGPDILPTVNASGNQSVTLSGVPTSPDSFVTARLIVASKAIDPASFTGNTKGYQLFFVPGGTINDNTTTTITVNFFDSQLLAAADGLLDIASEVPNGNNVTIYHNRLIAIGSGAINQARVSNPGEFEAFSNLDGFLVVQNDGLGLLNGQEYRDILYLFKINQTIAFTDNGDIPTAWPATIIDEGLGAGRHGVCYIDTREGVSAEYLLLHNYSGVFMFNGTFIRSELSFKIKDLWIFSLDRAEISDKMEFYNDVLHQEIFINIPSMGTVLIGDYANGMAPDKIRWAKWAYSVITSTITLFDKSNYLLIGSVNPTDPTKDGIYTNSNTLDSDFVFNSDTTTVKTAVLHSVELYLAGD